MAKCATDMLRLQKDVILMPGHATFSRLDSFIVETQAPLANDKPAGRKEGKP
ncbi:hypothetical protein [Novosphingobium humi]|uniref:hypothetical protein n=1 Tax=Novosphingobium humi TaxID=2282397 RepID=UPI0025AF2D0F|nr:hypothetical protein [Novosphingobium humi]WJS99410.1 hypothetical protein NYQ05_04485 [Novosphingobium humi]